MNAEEHAQKAYEQAMDLLTSGRCTEAILCFSQALEVKPDFATVYFNRAFAYNLLNEQEKAIEDYTQAIALDPENAWAYVYRAYAHGVLGRQEEVVIDCGKAIEALTAKSATKS